MKQLNFVILLGICVVKCLAMTESELEDFSNFLEMTSQLDLNLKSHGPDYEYDDDESISDDAWEESGKFEGDLILNERQRRLLVADIAEGLSRNGLQDSTKRWPNNEVIYYIQTEHFSSGQMQAIQDGIDDLAQASCVKFTPYKKGDRDAVVIQGSRRGCFSQVGYQGGYQVLNLSGRHPVGRGCFRHGTVVHELLHALGFYHMQSSPDRDDYIDVVWQNIVQPARHNFRKYNSFAVSDFGVGYDYESVLHYSRKAFSSNGQDTLVPKQNGAEIGQRIGLSQKDIQKLNKMYCDADSNDSNNSDDDSTEKTPVPTKKNNKNKPFQGHGIGYHQGKTVVIKIKPTVELYRLPTLPKFHTFDSFSKTPQALSPTLNEGRGRGKEIKHVLNLPASDGVYHEPINPLITKSEIGEEYTKKGNRINPLKQSGESELGVGLFNNEELIKNSSTSPLRDSYKYSEEDDTVDYHSLFPPYKKMSYSYPANFNTDYSKYYYNPEINKKKEPEVVKVDNLYRTSKLHTNNGPSYEYLDHSNYKTIPLEFHQHPKDRSLIGHHSSTEDKNPLEFMQYSKNLSFEHPSVVEDKFENTFPLRKYNINPNEQNNSELGPQGKYLSDTSINKVTNSTGYSKDYSVSNSDYPLKEKPFTGDRFKQNNMHYNKDSFLYNPDIKQENHNIPVSQQYVVPKYRHDSEINMKSQMLFDPSVSLTNWYKQENSDHNSAEEYLIKGNR